MDYDLRLETVRLVTETVEERTRWFKVLSSVCQGNINLATGAA